jgi:hypothetical protein
MAPSVQRMRAPLAVGLIAVASACWSHHQSHDHFLDFQVGMSKRAAFAAALESQRAGEIRNLEVIGDVGKTHDEQYRGTPIRPEDFDRVAPFAEWHSSLPDCNCWLRLHFVEDRLDEIVSHEWTGPTE